MIFKLLCKIGWHRPLFKHEYSFTDKINGDLIYVAECPCGRKWMVSSKIPMLGFKVELGRDE